MKLSNIKSDLDKRFHRPWFGGLLGGILTASLGLLLLFTGIGKGFRDWSYDLLFLLREEKNVPDVAVIYLDEEDYAKLHQQPSNFDRALYAKLIRQLKADGAKMVVFDILFIDDRKNQEVSDRDFAQAMREHGMVVLAAQLHHDDFLYENTSVTKPIEKFADSCKGWGIAHVLPDGDGTIRTHWPGNDQLPSLAWKSAELLGSQVTKLRENRLQTRWVNYYCREPFKRYSFYATVFDRTQLPSDFSLHDKVVFVGYHSIAGYSNEVKEEFRSPWTWYNEQNRQLGVELHALTFENLMRQDWLRRLHGAVEASLILLIGMLLGQGLSLLRPFAATAAAILFALAIMGGAAAAFTGFNLWSPWVIIVAAQLPLALGWSFVIHSLRSYVETKLLATSLALYLSPHQVRNILKKPELLKPGASQQTVSLLFSDIASFSKISEQLNPDDLVKLLNDYYETAIGCVHRTDGTVMNLIGDAIFAIWNAPEPQSDHAERACRAALELNQKLIEFDAGNTQLPLRTRIGLHTGNVCVGNIGSSTHFDYTAIGESVNMASRLEGLNKQLGTNILATREIQKIVEGRIVTRLVGHFKFKGFDQIVPVYELISTSEKEQATESWRVAFKKGLWHFTRKEFDQAAECFRQTLLIRPKDGPAKFYLELMVELKTRALPQEWMGEIDLREK